MPIRTKLSKRTPRTLEDIGIDGQLDLLAGCDPGDNRCPWPTWAALFADYRVLRPEFLARFPRTEADDHEPWIETAVPTLEARSQGASIHGAVSGATCAGDSRIEGRRGGVHRRAAADR